tara:strand:+ start:366 stop:515 length:150 start_codon:yes stop_codon:yes gene_type:complete
MLEGGAHDVNFGNNTLNNQPFNNPAKIEPISTQQTHGIMGAITFYIPGT